MASSDQWNTEKEISTAAVCFVPITNPEKTTCQICANALGIKAGSHCTCWRKLNNTVKVRILTVGCLSRSSQASTLDNKFSIHFCFSPPLFTLHNFYIQANFTHILNVLFPTLKLYSYCSATFLMLYQFMGRWMESKYLTTYRHVCNKYIDYLQWVTKALLGITD